MLRRFFKQSPVSFSLSVFLKMQHNIIDNLINSNAPAINKYAVEEEQHMEWKLHRLPMLKDGLLSKVECYCCSYIQYPRLDMEHIHDIKTLQDHVSDDELKGFVAHHIALIRKHEGCGCGSELSRRKDGFREIRNYCQRWSKAPERRKSQCSMQYNGTSKGSHIFQYFELEYAEEKAPSSSDMERG